MPAVWDLLPLTNAAATQGERVRAAHAEELALLARIKERKLSELQTAGVPAKYRAELYKTKIGGH